MYIKLLAYCIYTVCSYSTINFNIYRKHACNICNNLPYASSNDHDPSIGISDGRSFIGIKADDRTSLPCRIEDGDSSTSILKNVHQIVGPTATSPHYSSEIKIQLKPAEQWAPCHTEHDGGYTNMGNYQ